METKVTPMYLLCFIGNWGRPYVPLEQTNYTTDALSELVRRGLVIKKDREYTLTKSGRVLFRILGPEVKY